MVPTRAARLTPADRQFVDALTAPAIRGAADAVKEFKMLKRQMYGRAKSDLLRSRVLHAA